MSNDLPPELIEESRRRREERQLEIPAEAPPEDDGPGPPREDLPAKNDSFLRSG